MKNILLFLLFMTAASINAQTVMWTDDPEHTRIGFEVKHAGLSLSADISQTLTLP